MRIFSVLVLAASLVAPLTAVAQSKSDAEKVKTRQLVLPTMDATTIDYAGLVVDYAVGDLVFGAAVVRETEQSCPVKNLVTNEISVKKVDAWQWSVPYTVTDMIIVRDSAGAIAMVHPHESSGSALGSCLESQKKAASASGNQAKISKKENKSRKLALKPNVRPSVKRLLFVEYDALTVKVSAPLGDGHDYTALAQAKASAIAVYTSMMTQGMSDEAAQSLEALIPLWEKEVAGYVRKDKMARINKPVAKGLWMNIIDASIVVGQLERATAAGAALYAITGMEGDLSKYTPTSVRVRVEEAGGRAANPGSWGALHELALQLEGNKKFKINVVPFEELRAEIEAFDG